MMYEYQLNEDEGWTPLYTSSSVTYYDLKPGNHIFKVRRLGEPESETQVVVKIKSAIGYRWMAVGIMALIMIMIVWMIWSKKRVVSDDQTFIEKDALPMAELEKYKTNRISQEECKRLSDALEKYMLKEKPYVNPNLKLGDLASVLGTSSHTLSYLFSQYMNCSYYDYVTNYRIVEFKRLVKTGEYDKYTLTALSELCGFNSRASFFRSFKKVTGVTPSEYISQKE